MAIKFTFNPQLKILFTTAEGLVSFDDIMKHLDQEAAEKLLEYREIVDAYTASTNLRGDDVREIVTRLKTMARSSRFGPTAVVTNNDVFFGMAMMIQILSELEGGPQVAAFRHFDAGLDWPVRS